MRSCQSSSSPLLCRWLWLARDFRTGKLFSAAVFRHLWSNVQAMRGIAAQKPNTFHIRVPLGIVLLQHISTVLQISLQGFVLQRPYETVGRRLPSTDPFVPRERARVSQSPTGAGREFTPSSSSNFERSRNSATDCSVCTDSAPVVSRPAPARSTRPFAEPLFA